MMRAILREAGAYTAASAIAFAVDMLLLIAAVELLSWHYMLAAILGYLAGVTALYLMSTRTVFRQRWLKDRNAEFSIFLAIGLLGLAINSSAMAACVEILSLPYVTGKVVASSLTVGVNFTLRRWLLFSSVPRFLSDAELPSERRT